MSKRDATLMETLAELDAWERVNKAHYSEVRSHEIRVARTSKLIAAQIGMDSSEQAQVFVAARFHDIGKLLVPSAVLFKPGRLDPGERQVMERHTLNGLELLSEKVTIPQSLSDAILYHHERYDGRGYERLEGESVPYVARIVAIADTFDALTAERVYKKGMSEGEALLILSADERGFCRYAFDPFLLRTFVAMRLEAAGPEAREKLAEFAASDPMNDLAPGGEVTIKRSGNRVFWYGDEHGQRKQTGVMSPNGRFHPAPGPVASCFVDRSPVELPAFERVEQSSSTMRM